ncbi:hypothetical protein TNCV_372721 [Trichonephila clavipes]|nr:hypothetical protein TNCV_372721 [Trichonephila clavipes]
MSVLSQPAYFAHANVFHHEGKPVPIELSIVTIPRDGSDPEASGHPPEAFSLSNLSHLAFFAHANVFHHGGQPVPIELSIASIPEDGKDPKVICITVDNSNLLTTDKDRRANRYINERLSLKEPPGRIRASGIPGFLRQGQVLSPGAGKQRPHYRQGLGSEKDF